MGSGFSSSTTKPSAHPPTAARVMGEDVLLFAGDADPITLSILQLVKLSDAAEHEGGHVTMMVHLKNAVMLLKEVPEAHIDSISVLLFQREGFAHYLAHNVAAAKVSFAKAIQIAEVMVAERRPHLYMVLQRYCDCVLCLSSMWEKESANAYDLDSKHPRSTPANNVAAKRAIAVQDDPPQLVQLARSVAIYGPCEVALLRCIEIVEMGDHRQSELLILPLLELSRIYEALQIYTRAVLVIRRCIGLLCVRYGHNHMRLIDLNARCERLVVLRDEQILLEAVIKLQSLTRMLKAMHRLEATLNRRVKVHRLPPRAVRDHLLARNQDFLAAYVGILGKQQQQQLITPVAAMTKTSAPPPLGGGPALQRDGGTATQFSVAALQLSLEHRDDGDATPSPTAPSTSSPLSASVVVHGTAAAAATGGVSSRPSSSHTAFNVRQTALVNSGYTSNFARSSFAVGSRPTSGGQSNSRPSSAVTVSPQDAAIGVAAHNKLVGVARTLPDAAARAAVQTSVGGTTSATTGPHAAPLAVDRSVPTVTATTSTTRLVGGTLDDAAQSHRRSRLRSWAAYDPAQ